MKDILTQSELIQLRRTTAADLDFVVQAEDAGDNRTFVGQWSRQKHLLALVDRHIAHLVIETIPENQFVGYIIVTDLIDPNLSLNLKRIVIVQKGQGYGHAALHLLKKVAFEQWQAHRLWLDVKDFNQRARHLYEAEGFVVEGMLRECLKVGDNFESLVIMSVLQSEYQKVSS